MHFPHIHRRRTGLRLAVAAAVLASVVAVPAGAGEVGSDDFQISSAGPSGDARRPEAAYNSANNEYYVVWNEQGNGVLASGEWDIYGQRFAADGTAIDSPRRLSTMGPDGDPGWKAGRPAVVYNPTANEYLVTWHGQDGAAPEYEIRGQRIDAATGLEVGPDDFRISDMGVDGVVDAIAFHPWAAYSPQSDRYLVVWQGDENPGPGVANTEWEIYVQLLDGLGNEVGTNDLQISVTGANGDTTTDAFDPMVAFNSADNEFLVVWHADPKTGGLAPSEGEVFAERIDAATGAELGAGEVRISDLGPDGNAMYSALRARPAYNPVDHEYLVVFHGLDQLATDEFEVYGQRLDPALNEIGVNDFRVSEMGPEGDGGFTVEDPMIHYEAATHEYLVTWEGEDDEGDLVDGEFEIYGQRLDARTGAQVGPDDFRISQLGTDGDTDINVVRPGSAYNTTTGESLVVFERRDFVASPSGLSEIHGQRLGPDPQITGQSVTLTASDGMEAGSAAIAGDVTFEAWVRLDESSVGRNVLGTSYLGEGQIVVWSGGQLAFYHGDGSTYQGFGSSELLTLGSWAHVVVTRDLTAGTLRWFVNGVQTNERAVSLVPLDSGAPVVIGQGPLAGWVGGIDDVAIYDRALAPDEVVEHYLARASGPPTAYSAVVESDGPVSYWRFDESGGPVAVDATEAHDGLYVGQPILGESGAAVSIPPPVVGTSVGFSGDDGVEVSADPGPDLVADATFEAWVQWDGTISQSLLGQSYLGEGALVVWSTGQPGFYQGFGTGYQGLVSPVSIAAGDWVHLAVTRDATSQRVVMFIDGVEVASGFYGSAPVASGEPLRLGLGPLAGWRGRIDEVAVYDRPLTSTEIGDHYTTMAAGDPVAYAAEVVADGPVGYWRLDDAAGPLAADETGTHPGRFVGTPGFGEPGVDLTP